MFWLFKLKLQLFYLTFKFFHFSPSQNRRILGSGADRPRPNHRLATSSRHPHLPLTRWHRRQNSGLSEAKIRDKFLARAGSEAAEERRRRLRLQKQEERQRQQQEQLSAATEERQQQSAAFLVRSKRAQKSPPKQRQTWNLRKHQKLRTIFIN